MTNVDCFCTNLRTAALAGTEYYDARLAPAGIKVTMFRLLRQIERMTAPSLTELAVATGLDRSTLGRNVKVLEREGLVAHGSTEDGRAKALVLTEAGRAAIARALPHWEAAQAALHDLLGDDAERLIETLRTLSRLNTPAEKDRDHGI